MGNKLTPTSIQHEDADALLKYQHGYLWSEPGTGKTLTSLLAYQKGGYGGGVVVGPPLALGMWQDEIHTQLDNQIAVVLRKNVTQYNDDRLKLLSAANWLIVSYTMATRTEVKAFIKDHLVRLKQAGKTSVIIVDEAHMVKTPGRQRTNALFYEAGNIKVPERLLKGHKLPDNGRVSAAGICHFADSVWQLTGTPQTRWPDDLWTQLRFGRKEILQHFGVASFERFQKEFCVITRQRVAHGRSVDRVTGPRNLTRLKQLLDACGVVRRTLKEAAAELPPVRHRTVSVKIAVPRGGDMAEVEDHNVLLRQLNDKSSPYAVLYRMMGEAKVPLVVEHVLTQCPNQVLIGMWHRNSMDMLQNAIVEAVGKKLRVVQVHGSTSAERRDTIRDNFNKGEIDIIIGQMSAMNTSWNLQESAHHVVLGEQLPSPALVDQFYKRVYRKGQKNSVQVDSILADHWLDQAVNLIRIRKQATMEGTVYAV